MSGEINAGTQGSPEIHNTNHYPSSLFFTKCVKYIYPERGMPLPLVVYQ